MYYKEDLHDIDRASSDLRMRNLDIVQILEIY